jgi:hypothetical protein
MLESNPPCEPCGRQPKGAPGVTPHIDPERPPKTPSNPSGHEATNRCIITSYGVRRKFLVRTWELYPDLVQVECMPTDAGGGNDSKVINNKDYR